MMNGACHGVCPFGRRAKPEKGRQGAGGDRWKGEEFPLQGHPSPSGALTLRAGNSMPPIDRFDGSLERFKNKLLIQILLVISAILDLIWIFLGLR